ncbi:MAG TPA: phosphopantetheine adenylyltransferase [Paucimonas sp.]|nr:phosphopantetheine adenylyltransferase [Paucimonas sp.]
MQLLISISLVVAAIIHLLPLAGAAGPHALSALYGVPFDDPNLQVLMRHRAAMFGILGGFLLHAAFARRLQAIAILMGLASAGSFVWIAFAVGGYNAALNRVVQADLLAIGCLLAGGGLWWAHRLASR